MGKETQAENPVFVPAAYFRNQAIAELFFKYLIVDVRKIKKLY